MLATCVPLLIAFINIVMRPCVSHRFDLCQHHRALTAVYLLTPTHPNTLWAPRFLMRLTSTDLVVRSNKIPSPLAERLEGIRILIE
jgi:hypothetical protein